MKIAAIDLGSNSFHMVIVEVAASGAFKVIGREKEMVRLGADTLSSGRLRVAAMERGFEALAKYKQLADTHGVEKIIAVATAAIREARNGEAFLDRVGRDVGFWPRVVSGEEEGRLIYLAALHSVHLEGKRALVIDIGGGSVELALGSGGRLERVVSEKLGVLRMTERFVHSDPLGAKDEARLVAHVEEALGATLKELRAAGFDRVVGTSGTILAVAALALQERGERVPETLHHVSVRADDIHVVRKRLVESTFRERVRMAGMDERRADIVVAGAVVLDEIVRRLSVSELTLSDWSLREGILLNYIHGHPRSLARAEAYPDIRRRSVFDLAERCLYDEPHARHVAELALQLFEGTRRLHRLGDPERTWLENAALLHDIGHHISYPGHHRHTYYLIKNGDLRGFGPEEIEIIANVARYHRRGHPRKGHAGFRHLSKPSRRTVRVLAGILRIVDALDRSHRKAIRAVRVSQRGGNLRLQCEAEGNCDLELWGVPQRTQLLEETLGRAVQVETIAIGEAPGPGARARA
jgi:exopolyphosphatase / guanosine-5'-triphosphate,3'-diphosphate pyrophosphatase